MCLYLFGHKTVHQPVKVLRAEIGQTPQASQANLLTIEPRSYRFAAILRILTSAVAKSQQCPTQANSAFLVV